MHEAWGSESLSFSIVIIELSHSKEFGWLEPSKILWSGRTLRVQQIATQSENILVISFYLMYKIKWIS